MKLVHDTIHAGLQDVSLRERSLEGRLRSSRVLEMAQRIITFQDSRHVDHRAGSILAWWIERVPATRVLSRILRSTAPPRGQSIPERNTEQSRV